MYLLASFILQIFFKKILELIQSYEDKSFLDPKLVHTFIITFIYLLTLFIV